MKVRRGVIVAGAMALALTVVLMGAVGAKVVSPLAADEQNVITNLHLSDSCYGEPMVLFSEDTETACLIFDYSEMQGQEMRIAVIGPKFHAEAEHPSVTKSAGWTTEAWAEAHEGEYVKACGSVSPNATLTTTFTADTISMSYVKDVDGGIAEVQVDGGTPFTVDMCDTAKKKGEMVLATGLGSELHTITVRVITETSSCGGSCIGVDHFWNEVVLHDETHQYTDGGTERIELTNPRGGAFPSGEYVANVYAGSLFPRNSQQWYVRPGGPGEITNFYISSSPDGPPSTEFVAGTRTVWAVFDYAGMDGNEIEIDVVREETGLIIQPPSIAAKVSLSGSGTKEAISVTHQYLTGFPADQYRTHLKKDGFVDGVGSWSVLYGVYLPLIPKNH